MSQRTAAAIAGDGRAIDLKNFGRFHQRFVPMLIRPRRSDSGCHAR